MKILYFASIRERIGRAEETADVPPTVATARELIDWLVARGGDYARALGDTRGVRVAINHEHVKLDHPIAIGDEIAFFPPVTGG